MSTTKIDDVEYVVRSLAQTAVEKEKEFGDLDAVVGDGDLGYSLARGFEKVLADWDSLKRDDAATFLQQIALAISSRIGGTSGPLWGTAFLRASAAAKTADTIDGAAVVACSGEPPRASRSAATRNSETRPYSTPSSPPPTNSNASSRRAPRRRTAGARSPRRSASARMRRRASRPGAAAPATAGNAASARPTPERWPWPSSSNASWPTGPDSLSLIRPNSQ
jgi:hypothetical protein